MPRQLPKCKNVKEFDAHDWMLFGGAEKFADGKDPLMGTSPDGDVLFVACGGRIEIHVNHDAPEWGYDGDGEQYYYQANFPTQKGAEIFLLNLPQTWEEIEAMGFLPQD